MENENIQKKILEKLYLSADDLMQLMPIGLSTARKYILEARNEMQTKKYFVPGGRTKVALTKIIRKKFGI